MKIKLLAAVLIFCVSAANAQSVTDVTLVASKSSWKYLDNGSNQGSAWKASSFNDGTWATGNAELGFGQGDESTVVSYGAYSSNKYVTTYFRKTVSIITPGQSYSSLTLQIKRDDGAIVYINGAERLRTNMPTGTVAYNTYASSCASDNGTVWQTITLQPSYFANGTNYIAVEVHQCNATSSDLSFDLQLTATPVTAPVISTIGTFTSLQPTTQTQALVLPPTHTFQMITRESQAYTAGGKVPARADFTGYIPINSSSTNGYLHLNHEVTPNGAISNFAINYSATTKLWGITSSQAININATDIVKLEKNCSGAVTPWGTTLSGEETRATGDVNADGYQDVGWLVEVDPLTKSVKKNSSGKQEKLWALGRMAHENATVAPDSKTVYFGEDDPTGCLYKFVATNVRDLSSGTLYVLKLDSTLVSGAPTKSTASWIQVPNTTKADRNSTYSLAISLGATQFNGIEDVEYGPDGNVYFSSKGYGRVYRFKDLGTKASGFITFVGGMNYTINYGTGTVSEPWGIGNDNLAFDGEGNLWVLQDGGKNYIWVVKNGHTQASPKVSIFGTVPLGGEPTGITFSPDYKFLFMSVQHPNTNNTLSTLDAAGVSVKFNASTTIVISRKEYLGTSILKTGFDEPMITNIDLGNPVKVYPNPTNTNSTIEIALLEDSEISCEVYDSKGSLVQVIAKGNKYESGVFQAEISNLLTPGIYLVRTSINNKPYSTRLIKQ
jgi:hypothetical protein